MIQNTTLSLRGSAAGTLELSQNHTFAPNGTPLLLHRDLNWCSLCEWVWFALEERLSDNLEAAIADILKNSGAQALAIGDISAVNDAIETHLKLLATYLVYGQTQLPWGRVDGKENLDPFTAAVGAITLADVRRICAPRDMSADAATAFRAAADRVLASIY